MRIAGTGHRPDKLGGYEDSPLQAWVRKEIRAAFYELKPDAVMSGMALGFDMWLAEEAFGLGVLVHAAVPFPGQERKWSEAAQHRYRALLERCTSVTNVSDHFSRDAFQQRNAFMVNWLTMHGDDVLLSCWDGSAGGTYNCLQYAVFKKTRIRRINPRTFNPATFSL